MKEAIQKFGGFLAGMITPKIGAFIAWGLNIDY
jgi:mannitol-specific phosphotransferase system IIBC component